MRGKNPIIYLNNAATSFPKPPCVYEAAEKAMRNLPTGQFRDGSGTNGADLFSECRRLLGMLLGIRDTERICFTSGSTESLNLILMGLGIPADQIITTVTEHNSVLRPLYNLPGIGGKPILLPCGQDGRVSPELLEKEAARGNARAVVLNHCSNVTGVLQDAEAFGRIAKKYGLLFILDASQSAGCLPVETDTWQADAVAFTGHKSLLGLQGTGGCYVRRGVPFRPAKYGGTGRESGKLIYDEEGFGQDIGTQNTPGIAALTAACRWILQEGIEKIHEKELQLVRQARIELKKIPGIRVFEISSVKPETARTGPVLSFTADQMDPADLGYILNSVYGIIVRTGLHCSPLIHSYIGSGTKGTVRISFSPFNTGEDVEVLAEAMKEVLENR